MREIPSVKKKNEELREDAEKVRKKNKKDDDLKKHTQKDDEKKKRKVMKHAERRSRSKEDRIEGEGKRRRKLKAECVSPASISDNDLKKECLSFLFRGSFGSDAGRRAVIIINSMTSSAKRMSVMQCVSSSTRAIPSRVSLLVLLSISNWSLSTSIMTIRICLSYVFFQSLTYGSLTDCSLSDSQTQSCSIESKALWESTVATHKVILHRPHLCTACTWTDDLSFRDFSGTSPIKNLMSTSRTAARRYRCWRICTKSVFCKWTDSLFSVSFNCFCLDDHIRSFPYQFSLLVVTLQQHLSSDSFRIRSFCLTWVFLIAHRISSFVNWIIRSSRLVLSLSLIHLLVRILSAVLAGWSSRSYRHLLSSRSFLQSPSRTISHRTPQKRSPFSSYCFDVPLFSSFIQRAVSSSMFFCARDRPEVFDFSKNAMNFELSLPSLVVPDCSLDGFVVDFSVLLLYPLVHAFDPLNERFDLFIFFIFSASVLGIG